MNIQEILQVVPQDFADDSRVWIYQSSRPFSEQEAKEIKEQLSHFYLQWNSHGQPIKGWADLLLNRFIVVMADENQVALGGCSGDSRDRVLKSMERQYDIHLFDRLTITFLVKGQAEALPLNQVQYAIDKGFINGDTLLFNNTVHTKSELLTNWLQPLSQSWLQNHVALPSI